MHTYNTVEEVFQNLGARLYEFETERYIYADAPEDVGHIFEKEFNYHKLMNEIGSNISTHDPKKVFEIASLYGKRVRNIIKNLKKKKDTSCYDPELGTYLSDLGIIQKRLKKSFPKEEIKSTIAKTEVNLSPDFTIEEMSEYFKPKVTVRQAAYLLHYLQAKEIIPFYSVETLKKLAKVIFVRSGRNVTDEFRLAQYPKKKKDLEPVKKLLESILETIETEMKSAK